MPSHRAFSTNRLPVLRATGTVALQSSPVASTAICVHQRPFAVLVLKPLKDANEINATLRQNSIHHMSMHIGQTSIDAVVVECQLLMIQAEQMQNRRVEVRDRDFVFSN